MLAGMSTRRYPVWLEPIGQRTEQIAVSTSKSAVSRRFVAATETALAELLAAELSAVDLVGLMIGGVHFGEHTCVVALGIGIDGTKYPLSLVEGSTENATLVTEAAEAELSAVAVELDRAHPGAAASLREAWPRR
jgi:putative transposase